MAHTAAKAVWGEGTEHEEPASGVQGDVSKGEPFDGGNIDPQDQNRRDSKFSTEENEPLKKPTEETENRTETLASTTETPESTDEPDSNATQRDDAPDVTGSGPKPLAEIAKEHGGDAGNLQPGSDASSKGEAVGAIVAQDENPDSKGTGEKYVKTTGLAADGGDFDATKPGAGREADRLLEEKGVDREGGIDHKLSQTSSFASGSKEGKPSLKERIKDKLHIHKS